MNTLKTVKSSEVLVKPFVLDDFTLDKDKPSKIEKISKKHVKQIAQELGLSYDTNSLEFTQKIMTEYLRKR